MDRLFEGFQFLAEKQPWDDFSQPVSPRALTAGIALAEQMATSMSESSSENIRPYKFTELTNYRLTCHDEGGSAKCIQYPIFLCLIGSACVCFKVLLYHTRTHTHTHTHTRIKKIYTLVRNIGQYIDKTT